MSRIALGLMRSSCLSEKELEKLILDCLNEGIYFFDIADIYGNTYCETLLGKVLQNNPSLRNKMYIQTKVGICHDYCGYDSSYDYIIKATRESLKRMNIDCLDCLLLHRPDILMDNEEIAKAINYLMENDLVKHFGLSNFTIMEIEYLKQTLKCKIEYNQVQLGLGNTLMLDQTMYCNVPLSKTSRSNDDLLFYLKKENIIIQCWSPFQVGFFDGCIFDEEKYPQYNQVLTKFASKYHTSKCAIATAFLLRIDKNLMVVNGSMDFKHIYESLEGEKIELTREDWYKIYEETGHFLP